MTKESKLTDEDLKHLVFKKNPYVNFKKKAGIVTIVRYQNHPIQKFFRKLHVPIPKKSYLEMDKYGSFVFTRINGHCSAYYIGKELAKKFPETDEYCYTRLILFLQQMENNDHLIERV